MLLGLISNNAMPLCMDYNSYFSNAIIILLCCVISILFDKVAGGCFSKVLLHHCEKSDCLTTEVFYIRVFCLAYFSKNLNKVNVLYI